MERSLERPGICYQIYAEIGSGGMATVQYGRLLRAHGFTRSVAIKRLHPQFAKDPDFVRMFIDEARLSARLVHANIVATLDVIDGPDELALVMEYVHGESLWNLLRLANQFGQLVPLRVATALAASVLHGLHAAHEARNEQGELLDLVHRDVSPHNVLLGDDGIPRLIDFGIAKAVGRLRSTPSGEIKGKLIYMAPEQLTGNTVDRRADVYGAAAVLWETLTGLSLFEGSTESAIVHEVLLGTIEPPGQRRREVTSALDRIVMRGLKREPAERYATAREMALALERDVGIATQSEVADWLQSLAGGRLAERRRLLTELHESESARKTQLFPTPARAAAPSAASESQLRERALLSIKLQLAVGVAALLVTATALVWLRAKPAELSRPAPPPAATVAPAEDPVLAQPEAESEHTTSASAATDLEQPLPQGIAAPAEEPLPSLPPPQPTAAKPVAGAESKATAAPSGKAGKRSECTPYYYVDRQGVRRPKPECL